jgi:hypothetical protein
MGSYGKLGKGFGLNFSIRFLKLSSMGYLLDSEQNERSEKKDIQNRRRFI